MEGLIYKGSEMIKTAQNILVFTGAGLSTESGIPDFRSPGGIWDRYDPSDFYYHKIISDEKCRERYWKMSSEYYYCDECSGILKPDTISFGQSMPQEKMMKALMHSRECDLCIVLGSSLVVYPAASIPEEAANHGARLLIINLDETPLDNMAELVIHDYVSKTLSRIIERI